MCVSALVHISNFDDILRTLQKTNQKQEYVYTNHVIIDFFFKFKLKNRLIEH